MEHYLADLADNAERVHARVESHRPFQPQAVTAWHQLANGLSFPMFTGILFCLVTLVSVATWDGLQATTHWSAATIGWLCFFACIGAGGGFVALVHRERSRKKIELDPSQVDFVLAEIAKFPRLGKALERWIGASPLKAVSGNDIHVLAQAIEDLKAIDHDTRCRRHCLKKIDQSTSFISKARSSEQAIDLDQALPASNAQSHGKPRL